MKPMDPTSEATRKKYDELARDLGAEQATMFGMPTLKVNGKAFGGVFGDDLTFKLTGDAHAGALALKGAKLFDPSGTGRPMKEWVVVPAAHSKKWAQLGRAALEFVAASSPKKPVKAKKA